MPAAKLYCLKLCNGSPVQTEFITFQSTTSVCISCSHTPYCNYNTVAAFHRDLIGSNLLYNLHSVLQISHTVLEVIQFCYCVINIHNLFSIIQTLQSCRPFSPESPQVWIIKKKKWGLSLIFCLHSCPTSCYTFTSSSFHVTI